MAVRREFLFILSARIIIASGEFIRLRNTTSRSKNQAVTTWNNGLLHLHVAGLFPFTGSLREVGLGVRPAVELAADHVNKNPTILPGVKLHVTYHDTQVPLY